MVTTLIFPLIDIKDEFKTKQQHPCHFCYDQFLDSGWSSCGGIISFLKTIVECYQMECSLSPMRPVSYIIPTSEVFWISLSIGFEVIYENPSLALEYLQPHVSYILSKTNNSSTQLKVLSNWSNIINFVFPYITSSIECVSKF